LSYALWVLAGASGDDSAAPEAREIGEGTAARLWATRLVARLVAGPPGSLERAAKRGRRKR